MSNYYELLGVNSAASFEQIQKAYSARLRHCPPEGDPEGYRGLREAYENLANPSSRRQYDSLQGLDPGSRALMEEAVSAGQKGELDRAIELTRRVLKQSPQADGARMLLGICLFRKQLLTEAIEHFDRLCQAGKPAVIALQYAARARVELAQLSQPCDALLLDEAYRYYQRAEELDPKNGEIPMGIAIIHWLRREDPAALRCVEQAVRADGVVDYRDVDALRLGAQIRIRGRQWTALDEIFKRIESACQTDEQRTHAAHHLIELAFEAGREGGHLQALRAGWLARRLNAHDRDIQRSLEMLCQSSPPELVAQTEAEQPAGATTSRMIPTPFRSAPPVIEKKVEAAAPPVPPPVPPPPKAKAKPAGARLAVVAVVLLLLAGFAGAGAVGYRLFLARPRPFCGSATPPQGPDASACRKLLGSFGEVMQKRFEQRGEFPFDGSDISALPRCPLSNETYGFISSDDNKQAWMFCPGCTHSSQPNVPAFDFASGKVTDQPVEPPEATWAHYQWLCFTALPANYEKALAEQDRVQAEEAIKDWRRSFCLKRLGRYQEAYEVLQRTNPADCKAAVECLEGLGRYDEALVLANKYATGQLRITYLKGDFDSLLKEANDYKGSIPSVWLKWIALARGDQAEIYKQSRRYLEAAGLGPSESGCAVLMMVSSAIAGKDAQELEEAKKMLRRALAESPRCWPFPLLQLYNREVTEAALAKDRKPVELMELRVFSGLLLEANGQPEAARQRYQWTVDHGDKGDRIYRVALSRLGK